jgi:hypothetical protein
LSIVSLIEERMVRPPSCSDYKYSLCKTGNMKNSILVASICTILFFGDNACGYGLDCSFPILNQTFHQDCGGLPDKSLTYRDYMDSCERFYSKEECQSEEDARLNRNRIQPMSMVVSSSFRVMDQTDPIGLPCPSTCT